MTEARIYVGTYAKYNAGSIKGAWLNLEDYSDKDAFLEACKELHKDEADPELMFQDYEGFPKAMYSESSIPESLWAWLELDEDDRELLAVYQDAFYDDADINQAREAFAGRYDSEEDWAVQFVDDCGYLNDVPDMVKQYFDYAAYARDARLGGNMVFIRHDHELWVFYNT